MTTGRALRPRRDVHVWRVELARDAGALDLDVLDADERRRAGGFAVEDERWRFTASHAALRHVLAGYAGVPPGELRLTRDGGRPRLLPDRGGLEFSLSHSGGLALVAVARGMPVGVDVEQVRDVDHAGLAERVLAPAGAASLAALPPAERLPAFFRHWACTEAYLKVDGRGLAGLPGPAFTLTGGEAAGRPGWTVRELAVGAGFAAAVAAPAHPVDVTTSEWSPDRPPTPTTSTTSRER
ncbi:4'-phosphopantetheinyl transferase family protein [Saccharothrix sp. DSM 118769]